MLFTDEKFNNSAIVRLIVKNVAYSETKTQFPYPVHYIKDVFYMQTKKKSMC